MIKNVEVYGLEESIIASGYPMHCLNKLAKDNEGSCYVTERDVKRAKNLGNVPIASGHDQFLTGIIVQFDLTFPVKLWTEAQRYHFFDFVSSGSTMHALFKTNLLAEGTFEEHTDALIIKRVADLQAEYNRNKTEDNFLRLVMSCPVGINLTARMTTNYRQLKTMYSQRKDHRLIQWKEFCKFIEGLPYSKEFGVI